MSASNTWKRMPLGEVAELIGGGTPRRSQKEFFGDDLPWVTPSDLPAIGEVKALGGVSEGLTFKGLKSSSAKKLPYGTVLFSSRASIGKIAIADRECCTNQGFANFIPDPGRLDNWFLAYLLCRYTPEITSLAASTTFKEVSRSKLKTFEIPLPPLSEQRRIVARIKECMERIEEMERLRNQIDVETTSLLSSILWDIERRIGTETVPLVELLESTHNGRSIKSNGDKGNGSVLTLASLRSLDLDFNCSKHVEMPCTTARKFQIRKDDVFVSRANTRGLVGLSAIARTDGNPGCIFPDLMIKLTPIKKRILPSFFVYALRLPGTRQQIQDFAKGTSQSMVKISSSSLKRIRIPCPTIKRQQELVLRLEEYRRVVCAINQELVHDDTPVLRKAVLRKAFTGAL